jgi:hypothetical protein
MGRRIRLSAIFWAWILAILLPNPTVVRAGVVVFDQVTTVGQPVFLKFLTKGKFFPKGGRRVTIQVANRQTHKTLSGGDGYAYYKYLPQQPGLEKIVAFSDNEQSSGLILVLADRESVIVIGVEGALQNTLFSEEMKSKSRDAIHTLGEKFRIVYLSRWFGNEMVKNWLDSEKFPSSVVLRWRSSQTFKNMTDHGVTISAVIGSKALLQAAPDDIDKRFTFEKTTKGTTVKDWAEIVQSITAEDN